MGARLVCERKCIFRNRRYKVGEIITPRKGEAIPRHFVPVESVAPVAAAPEEAKTLKEMQDMRAKPPKTGMAAQPDGGTAVPVVPAGVPVAPVAQPALPVAPAVPEALPAAVPPGTEDPFFE